MLSSLGMSRPPGPLLGNLDPNSDAYASVMDFLAQAESSGKLVFAPATPSPDPVTHRDHSSSTDNLAVTTNEIPFAAAASAPSLDHPLVFNSLEAHMLDVFADISRRPSLQPTTSSVFTQGTLTPR